MMEHRNKPKEKVTRLRETSAIAGSIRLYSGYGPQRDALRLLQVCLLFHDHNVLNFCKQSSQGEYIL